MKTKILISMAALICIFQFVYAQNEIPREYISPEELVSLHSEIDLSTALDLLSEYAIQFLKKPIYDPQKRSGIIGVDIRSLHWKKALGLILSRRGLWYVEKPRYIEVVAATDMEASLTGQSKMNLDSGVELKTDSREIKIETIFFEGDRKALNEIGLDWSTFYRGKVNIDARHAGALEVSDNIVSFKGTIPQNLIGVDLDLLLKVFDSKKFGKVLAQPQVVVTEGKEGVIQVGQDFSIKERDFAGNVIDRFYSTGTILKVTPYVILNESEENPDQPPFIFLRIHVERSTAHPDVVSTIINKSQANSFIQLFDGEETLIAGLYSTEKNIIRKGIPILKDMPWWFLGFPYIFGYNRVEEAEKELVIIIKASLLKTVFDRQKLSKKDVMMNLKHTVQQPNLERYEPQLMTETRPQLKQSESMAKTVANQTFRAVDPQPLRLVQTDNARSEFHIGKIITVKDQLVLVHWNPIPLDNTFNGQSLPIVRKNNSSQKVDTVGKAKIIQTKKNHSVAKFVPHPNQSIQRGDYVVGKSK